MEPCWELFIDVDLWGKTTIWIQYFQFVKYAHNFILDLLTFSHYTHYYCSNYHSPL